MRFRKSENALRFPENSRVTVGARPSGDPKSSVIFSCRRGCFRTYGMACLLLQWRAAGARLRPEVFRTQVLEAKR